MRQALRRTKTASSFLRPSSRKRKNIERLTPQRQGAIRMAAPSGASFVLRAVPCPSLRR
jgi:hypothetical protein